MSYIETVREALIEAEELKDKVLREQGEIQFATRRLVTAAMDLQGVIWRLKYELERNGIIGPYGDPIEGPRVPTALSGAIQTAETEPDRA